MFPNPVKQGERFAVKLQVTQNQDATLECYDPLGRRVITRAITLQKGDNLINIELDGAMSGMYYAKIKAGTLSNE